jgi:hypothetical protein
MIQRSSKPVPAPGGCRIAAHALVESPLSQLQALRGRSAPAGAPPLPPRFLRHADEHTVVGLHAVLEAIAGQPQRDDLESHAVVAAPCQSGRLAAARTLTQLSAGGAVTVSPHIVPQCSLHSVAGAVSVALGMHGPHLGVGGGPDALAEGLFAATTLVTGGGDPACTAAWLVATDWDEEPALDADGEAREDPVCRALAVLLEPLDTPDDGGGKLAPLSLSVRTPRIVVHGEPAHETSGGLVAFARAVAMCAEGGALATWTVTCPWGAEIRLSGRQRPAPVRLREAA